MKITNNTDTDKVLTYPEHPSITIPAHEFIEVAVTDKGAFTAVSVYLQCKEEIRTGQIVVEGGPITFP